MASAFSTAMASSVPRTEFERQRGELVQEIAESFEHVLASINKLNRNLEAVITVGNEFASVEALWSTFENVMGNHPNNPNNNNTNNDDKDKDKNDDDDNDNDGDEKDARGAGAGTPGEEEGHARKRGDGDDGHGEDEEEEEEL